MSSETPPGAAFPENPDPEQTVDHRTPQPGQSTQPAQGGGSDTRQPAYGPAEELGFGGAPAGHTQEGYTLQPAPEQPKGGRGWIMGIIAAVVVVLLGGGGVWAVNLLSGGGAQPEDVLPGNAVAYARLDLDPAANQKLALFSIGRKFPGLKDSLTGDDPRKAFFEAIRSGSPELAKLDYAKDIEPWLGDRVGLAVTPPAAGSEEPGVAVAVQVKDEAAARDGLKKLASGDDYGVAFREDYAIVAQTQAAADNYAKAAPLSQNAQFTKDLADIGEPGVLSFWADMGNLVKASGLPATDTTALSQFKDTRFAGALRFNDNYVELSAATHGGTTQLGDVPSVKIGQLPDTTVAALSVSGAGKALATNWPQVEQAAAAQAGGETFTQSLEQIKQLYGISIPDDIATLFGDSITIALDGQGLDAALPNVGAVITTDPAKAATVVGKLENIVSGLGAPLQLGKTPGDGQYVLASNQAYADKLAAKGTLGNTESFKAAVPNADSAKFAAYVDLDKLEPLYLAGMPADDKANLEVLRAVGMSGTSEGTDGQVNLRVLFN
ncbi:hypothetical protein Pth03_47340 [Planotetraspora thailandica]|uniref:DUF3352 domain-containing protein n=1 Tax=Planotetraspora thailandica TaxID=487172 RepID=A0A8J3XXP2_9ACTN|nr:DUF3352 domain-containing protein [Planotetraspora thailandica]GII56345.1 hypothetical protein Pth03_47340 [Planotetraspora thailandica]